MKEVLEVLPMDIMPSHEELSGMNQQEGEAGYIIQDGPDQSGKLAEGKKSEGAQNKKNKWGALRGERRSTRLANDSRPAMEKAKENKKKGLWRITTTKVKLEILEELPLLSMF
jgi:hypothetical protein